MFRRLASAAALVATAALVLVGCTLPEPTETTPAPSPAPSASSAPIPSLASLEALQAEAVTVATRFLSLTDQGFSTGTLPSEQLRSMASEALVLQLEAEVAAFSMQGLSVGGESRLDSPSLVNLSEVPTPGQSFELLACVDTSDVLTTDATGEPVSGGVTRQPRVFEFLLGEALTITATTPPASETELPGCGS